MGEEGPALLGKCAASKAPKTFFVLLRLGLGERVSSSTALALDGGCWCDEHCRAEDALLSPKIEPHHVPVVRGKGLSWKRELDRLQRLPKQLKTRD